MMTSSVNVVVVAYGAPGLLDACLGALGGEFPVWVVDNSSQEKIRELSERHGATYVDPGHNLGFAGGVNLGLAQLDRPADDVLLLNPDAQISAQDVVELQRCLHAASGTACVAPAQLDRAEGAAARVGWPFPTPLGAWVEAVGLGRLRRRTDFVIGSVLLLHAGALAEVGPFDERFFLYAEETDWQRRAHGLGWSVTICPDVIALHEGAGTDGDPTTREIHFHASHERYLRKYYGSPGWQVYRAGAMSGALIRAVVLPRPRGRAAAARFHLYRQGPCRVEARST